MFRFRYISIPSIVAALATTSVVHANGSTIVKEWVTAAIAPAAQTAPEAGTIEYAFSPGHGAEALVLKTINAGQREVRVMAYSLTSAPVVQALVAAKRRGVDVRVLADHKQNTLEDRSGKARAALATLSNAGAAVRTIDAYLSFHDKVLIVDGRHVQTGSYNYSAAAAKSNSENVLVLWNNSSLAQGYLAHWQRRWSQGRDWQAGY